MRSGDEIRWEGGNAAMRVLPDQFPQVYYKSKLVPGAEFFPFKKFLPFLGPLVRKLGGSYAGLIPQDERVAFYHTSDSSWAAGPIICYESVFGEYVSGYIEQGATMLFIMTNDGWWDNTPGHKQHLAYASLRAIEQRKPIARAANTGISGFIDVYGRAGNLTRYNEANAVQGTIYPNSFRTVYSRTGDVIARFCLLLLGGFLLYSLAIYLKHRSKLN
jgi:apolipoprotein N-acyltransferase